MDATFEGQHADETILFVFRRHIIAMRKVFFKFGTIIIQTFVGDLVIRMVEHPSETYNKLQDAVYAAEASRRSTDEEKVIN